MKRRWPPMALVIGGLFLIGVLRNLYLNTMDMIIPVLIFGLVFLLYKFPPDRWRRGGAARPPAGGRKQAGRKHPPFRVIQGNKRDQDDQDENRPRYH
ncbi:hypothetical protein J31TS4_09070 [Paenibacillus sp. J31TS4]|uniref:hypothetical protein n=1 Tax=Paenibacillus sp. J31TS4 TaxID=2807195 RepID=UPI001B1E8E0C|nr:hypothetical protein [Paenibacillus sp. J31TS4]GIP37627.1 hypothetical protein J31TS4_09070 [Paenibacillus sp. J31TS4]